MKVPKWLKNIFNWLLLKDIFRRKKGILVSVPAEVKTLEREPSPAELVLGWAYGLDFKTDECIWQLKGIEQKYRAIHFYIIGATGAGKTKFLENLIQQDIANKAGFGIIDPHGDLIEDVKGWLYLCSQRALFDLNENVILIEPTNPKETVSFNPLEQIKGVLPEAQAKELVGVFKKIWWDAWGARMEDILRNSFIALIENNLTLVELPLLLTNTLVRKRILKNIKNPICLERFRYFESLRPSTWREWIESTLNKVDAFLSDPRIRQILALPKSSFDLRNIIDNQKILLIKLEKGQLKDSADLLGSLLLSKIQMAAFSRTDVLPEQRVPFYLYIDEFQNFATRSFIDILSEARKYKLSLILANQNLAQLHKELQASILANCGIQVCFRVSREDAQIMAKELMTPLYRQPPGWEINVQTIQELPDRKCFVKNKAEGGIILIETPQVFPPWQVSAEAPGEFNGITPETFKKSVKETQIGEAYLTDREIIEKEYQKRYKELTASEEPKSFREPKK
jgi:hypothetical protein